MKPCKKCGETKPLSEFYKEARARDGLRNDCKLCSRARHASWHESNRERHRITAAAWRAANREKDRAIGAAYRAANPERIRARDAKRYAANIEYNRAKSAAWYAANREYARAKNAAYYVVNNERCRANSAEMRKSNPEQTRIYSQNRRARERAAGGTLSTGLAAKLFKLQRGKCACCGFPLGDNYHLDHIMPLVLGGTNTDDNIQLLRKLCNQKKHAKHPVDFMRSKGFLL